MSNLTNSLHESIILIDWVTGLLLVDDGRSSPSTVTTATVHVVQIDSNTFEIRVTNQLVTYLEGLRLLVSGVVRWCFDFCGYLYVFWCLYAD